MKLLPVLFASLCVMSASADPALIGTTHGVSPCDSECASEIVASVPAGSSGELLVLILSAGPTIDAGPQCPAVSDAGWSQVFSIGAGGPSTGRALCGYSKVSDGTESSVTVVRPDFDGVVWFVARVSGASSILVATSGGTNPPAVNFGSAGTSVVLAAAYCKATVPPAGYTLDFAAGTGYARGASLSVADILAFGSSEDPSGFTPNQPGAITATIGIR